MPKKPNPKTELKENEVAALPPAPAKKSNVDPEIRKLRARHQKEIKEYMDRRASAALLKTILEKRLPRLCREDLCRLYDELAHRVTPPLPFPKEPVAQQEEGPQQEAQPAADDTTKPAMDPWKIEE